jgi:hypothetical protein
MFSVVKFLATDNYVNHTSQECDPKFSLQPYVPEKTKLLKK